MADKSVLQEFTINFDLDLSNVEKATQEVQKTISAIGAEYLPQLENMLNEVTQSVGELADTTALQTMIDNIKNGVEVSTDEIIKVTDETFTALSEVMENQGYLWDEKAKEWVKTTTEALETIENEVEQTSFNLGDIFSNVKSWFSDLFIGGFGGFGILNSVVDTIQETFAFQGKNNGFFSQNDLKTAQEYQKSLSKINEFLGQIQKMIARFLLPVIATLSTLLTKTIDFIVKHHKTIMLFLGALAIALSGIIKAQLAILATQLKILAPYIAIAAAAAAIVAIIEDIYYYFKGWDSVTGELVEKFPLLGTALEIIRPLIMGIFETIDKIKEFFQNPSLDNFIAIFESIIDTIANQAEHILNIFDDALTEIFTGLKNWIVDTFTAIFKWFGEKIEAITKPIKKVAGIVGGGISKAKDSINGAVDNALGFFGLDTPVLPAHTSTQIDNKTTYNNNMEFTLNGVDERVAKSMSNDISRQINQYQSQVSSKGVK